MSIKRRIKRYLFDRYFRWETETLSAPPQNVVNEKFERDGFQLWLSLINPGMLDWRNLRLFDHCVRNLPSDAPVVEIGSFAGLSLNNLAYLLRKYDRANKLISTDAWFLDGSASDAVRRVGSSNVTWGAYRDHVIETFRRNTTLFSHERLPHHVEMSSDQFFAHWNDEATLTDFFNNRVTLGGPISFAYIDGDHGYEQSKRDFEHVDRWLVPSGFIVFDDSADGARSPTGERWGCNRTAREAAALPHYRVVDATNHYCIQKIR